MKKINSFTKICFLITSIFLFSCKQPANPVEEPPAENPFIDDPSVSQS